MIELQRGMRNSFLINRKPTQTEIYRIESLFKQVKDAITTIQMLVKRLGSSGGRIDIRHRIKRETANLITTYDFLDEMVRNNKRLEERFIFDMGKIRMKGKKALQKFSDLAFTNSVLLKKR